MTAPAPSTLNDLNPGKKRVVCAPACRASSRPALTAAPAISAVACCNTSRRLSVDGVSDVRMSVSSMTNLPASIEEISRSLDR
jgi:hypothetical protein